MSCRSMICAAGTTAQPAAAVQPAIAATAATAAYQGHSGDP